MSAAATALMLVCAGQPTSAAGAANGSVGVIRLPVNEAMREKLQAEPPIGRLHFLGEATPQREWIIGGSQDAATGQTQLIRLAKSGDPLSPFAFKAGTATQQGDEVAFAVSVEGKCDIRPANISSGSETK